MWLALFTAFLDWLTGLVKSQTQTAGEDVVAKPGIKESLNKRLADWKASKGAS